MKIYLIERLSYKTGLCKSARFMLLLILLLLDFTQSIVDA